MVNYNPETVLDLTFGIFVGWWSGAGRFPMLSGQAPSVADSCEEV